MGVEDDCHVSDVGEQDYVEGDCQAQEFPIMSPSKSQEDQECGHVAIEIRSPSNHPESGESGYVAIEVRDEVAIGLEESEIASTYNGEVSVFHSTVHGEGDDQGLVDVQHANVVETESAGTPPN